MLTNHKYNIDRKAPFYALTTRFLLNMLYYIQRRRQRLYSGIEPLLRLPREGFEMSKRKGERRGGLTTNYVRLCGDKCANPDCKSGYGLEGHHIIPLAKGGADKYWNLITLCRQCHRKSGHHYHRDYQDYADVLFLWKTTHEMYRFGFVIDEEDENFQERLNEAFKITREEEDAFKAKRKEVKEL